MAMLASIIKGVWVFAKWEIVVRYASNCCVAFAAFPVLLTIWILRGHRTPPLITYIKLHLSLAKKLIMELLVV